MFPFTMYVGVEGVTFSGIKAKLNLSANVLCAYHILLCTLCDCMRLIDSYDVPCIVLNVCYTIIPLLSH